MGPREPLASQGRGKVYMLCVTIIVSETMTVTQNVNLGPHESKLLFEFERQGVSVFTLADARGVLGLSPSAAADVLYRLRQKGRVVGVRKGSYLLVPARAGLEAAWSENAFLVVDALLEEVYCVGFWAALNYWGLTGQIPRVVHVVAAKRRRNFEFGEYRVRFVSLKPEKIFGYVREPLEGGGFAVSNREKTILDCLAMPEYCGGVGEVARALSEGADALRWSVLEEYTRRLGIDAVRRRLGYLLDSVETTNPLTSRWRGSFRGFRWLDPSAPKERLGYTKEWGLILNVEPGDLRGEAL